MGKSTGKKNERAAAQSSVQQSAESCFRVKRKGQSSRGLTDIKEKENFVAGLERSRKRRLRVVT